MHLDENPGSWTVLDETDSTNQAILNDKYPSGSVILARQQINGRGRNGRAWHSIKDRSFIFSGLLRFPLSSFPRDRLSLLPLCAGISTLAACRKAVELFSPGRTLDMQIKWPNDLYIISEKGPGKLGGILVESSLQSQTINTVIGIGLNWSDVPVYPQEPGVVPPVCLLPGSYISPLDFAPLLLRELNARLPYITENSPPAFVQELRKVFFLTGRSIKREDRLFTVKGLADDGGLIIMDSENEMIVYDYAEYTF